MLCTARGEMQAAREIRQDLKNFLGGVDSGGWDLQVGRYLSGSITHDELLCAAHSSNALRMKHNLCTAYCLAGGLALEAGQKQAAADSFEKAIAAKIDDSFAFNVAAQVLETMGNQSPR
jgi:lipoprotein NlpI